MTNSRSAVGALVYVVLSVVLFALFVAGLGAIFAWLWNQLMPGLFGLPTMQFVEGVLAVVLLWFIGAFFRR